MFFIVPDVNSLNEYISYLAKKTHMALRPDYCIHCGRAFPWCHGSYTRKADRENSPAKSLNPASYLSVLLLLVANEPFRHFQNVFPPEDGTYGQYSKPHGH